jgi:hypothetical protein
LPDRRTFDALFAALGLVTFAIIQNLVVYFFTIHNGRNLDLHITISANSFYVNGAVKIKLNNLNWWVYTSIKKYDMEKRSIIKPLCSEEIL